MQNCTGVDEVLWRSLNLETPTFVAQLLPQLVELVRCSRRLPLGEEHAIRRSSRDFLVSSQDLGQSSIRQAHQTLRFLDARAHLHTSPEELGNFNLIIDSIDTVLERVDGYLRDAVAGKTQAPEDEAPGAALSSRLSAALGGPKPQVRWRQLVDNERTQFVPRILQKHNQKAPLAQKLVAAQRKVGLRPVVPGQAENPTHSKESGALQFHLEALGVGSRPEDSALPHPYDEELSGLCWPEDFFQPRKAQRYTRLEDTPLVIVRTESELRHMIQEIKVTCAGKEIAVDVEHHDFRSYRGFVCLIQVSTRQKDFIVDPFDIFPQLHMLNEVFSDPGIVKVLHGADRDVLWLQRDFSVYLVNMFDTGQATRALRLPGGFSYANLVSTFCGVKLDKKYQTADWRERPLPAEMVQYARADTHYLLYCYDCLRNALLGQHGFVSGFSLGLAVLESGALQVTDDGVHSLQVVLDKSTALARMQYMEAPLDASAVAKAISERYGSKQRPLEAKQFSALQALAEWRDRLARTLDESCNFVAPDTCLWRVAVAMPSSPSRLRSTCNPLPPKLQQHADEVVELVMKCTVGDTAIAAAPTLVLQASPAVPHPEDEADVVLVPVAEAPRLPWPVRSPGSCPRPLVHVTVACGSGKSKQITSDGASGANGRCTVLCAFSADSESEAEEAAVQTNGRAKTDFALRFAAVAPAAPAAPAAAPMAPATELSIAANGEEKPREAEAEDPALDTVASSSAPLRSKKRKRNRPAASKSLETLVANEAEAADDQEVDADPYAAVMDVQAGQEHSEAHAAAASKKRKKAKKAQLGEKTAVDPYL